jgi:hypothetical protein
MFSSYHVPGRKRVYAPSPLSSQMETAKWLHCVWCGDYPFGGSCECGASLISPESPLPPLAQDVNAMESEDIQLLQECFPPQQPPTPIYSAGDMLYSQECPGLTELDFGNLCTDFEQVRRDLEQTRFSENELRRKVGLLEGQVSKLMLQQDALYANVEVLQKFREAQLKRNKATAWKNYSDNKGTQRSYLQAASTKKVKPKAKEAGSSSSSSSRSTIIFTPYPQQTLQKFQNDCEDRQKLESFYSEVNCTCIACGKNVKEGCDCQN